MNWHVIRTMHGSVGIQAHTQTQTHAYIWNPHFSLSLCWMKIIFKKEQNQINMMANCVRNAIWNECSANAAYYGIMANTVVHFNGSISSSSPFSLNVYLSFSLTYERIHICVCDTKNNKYIMSGWHGENSYFNNY